MHCRHATNPTEGLAEPRAYDWVCSHESARREGQPDYVMGLPVVPWQDSCVTVRRDPNRCGINGRYWEPKEGIG